MITSTFNDIEISALATAVPTKWTPIEEFDPDADPGEIKIFKKGVGVEGRYDAVAKQTTSDLAYVAAKAVLDHKKVRPEDVGLLIFVTQSPDYRTPATACVLHKRLGLSHSCMAFDVNQGCSGMVYGLNIACSLLTNAGTDNALLLLGDITGKKYRRNIAMGELDKDDSEARLFGDAGAAVLLQKKETADPIYMGMCTDGSGYKALIQPYGQYRHHYGSDVSYMDGTAIFDFSISRAPELIRDLMADIKTTPEEYDCLALHQANKLIMKQIAKYAGFSREQNLIAIDQFGNTTSASIATALTKHYGEDEDGRIRAMLCGYGIGLSWGAVSMEMNKKDILPLILTDEYFDDGYPDEQPAPSKIKG